MKIIAVTEPRPFPQKCEDFAALDWPKGATDYLAEYNTPEGDAVVIGQHVDGWTADIIRKGVMGWNVFVEKHPSVHAKIIWVQVRGSERRDPDQFAQDILTLHTLITRSLKTEKEKSMAEKILTALTLIGVGVLMGVGFYLALWIFQALGVLLP